MNNTNELKPCPFCGGKAELVDFGKVYSQFRVICETDGCIMCAKKVTFFEERFAKAAWNKRAEEKK